MVVQKEWMSEYQHNLLGVGVAPTEVEKLVPNLRNKDRYVLHYRNLQLYMSLGMRLTKVHRALRFDQSPLMEPYIQMNSELWERPLQVDEQLGLREDHGEPAEAAWCEAGAIKRGGQTQAPHRQPSICSG